MIARFVKIIAISILVMSGLTETRALAVGLPQVPGATQKPQAGGMSAGASLEGPSGSALEPYLITWLLPAFGLIAFVFALRLIGDFERAGEAKRPLFGYRGNDIAHSREEK